MEKSIYIFTFKINVFYEWILICLFLISNLYIVSFLAIAFIALSLKILPNCFISDIMHLFIAVYFYVFI